MNKTRMGKRAASLLLSLVMMLSLLPTAAYAAMADGVETQGAIVSENGTGVSDDSNSSGGTDDLQVKDSEGNGDTGDRQVGGSSVSGTADDTTGAEGGADPTDSVNGNDSADPQDDGDAVLPVASSVVSTSEELVAAIAAASDGDTITLGAGEFTTVGNTSPEKSLTFVGAGTGTVWTIGDLDKDVGGEGNGDYSFEGCDTITFKNMTLKVDNKNYRGFIRINNTVVENCTLEGRTAYWGYETAKFVGSTFNAPGDDYALWDYSTKAMSFDSCTFNISGKGVHVYVEAANADKDVTRTVAVNNCTVNSDKANKAFLNIKNSTQAYDVTLSGTNTVNGLTANGTTGSALYQVETTEVTETTGKPVAVKAKADDGTVTTLYEVKETVEASVAEVNGAKYDSLQAAVDAAKSGATVTLLADTRENVTIATAMTLDLNGHTLNGGQVKAKPALTVTARVTVKDSSAAQTGTIMREDTAENSGVSSHYVIDIQGKGWLTFESGNVKNNSGVVGVKGASLVRVGDDSVAEYPGLTISGGTFTQDNFIVIKVDRGTFYLKEDGTLNSKNSYAVENWKFAEIKGGTVNGTVAAWTYSGGHNSDLTISGGTVNGNVLSVNYGSAEGKLAKVSITGGTVNGALDTRSYDPSTNELTSIDDATKATIAVTGGTFSEAPTKYVVEDSAITPNADGTYGVAKAYLAKVGNTSYYTMEEAFKAQTASGADIVLLRDYTTGSTFNSGSIARTVDLNGHTWTCTGTDANSAAFEINYSDASLTVKNGKVVSSQLVGLIPSAMGGTIKYDNSSLVFEGVEMTTTARSGIETNGNNTNDTVTLRNSTLNVPNGFGIYFPSSGTLTIDNSVINAETMGVQVCSGSLNVTGADTAITVSGDGIDKTINDGAIEDGAAISIVNRAGYKGLDKIKVEGGKFTAKGDNAAVKAYNWENQTASAFDNSKNVVAISGGTFSSAVDKSLCAEGYIPTQNADGTYGVKEGKYVAEIGSQGYESLQEAVAAAEDGQTVTLLADATEDVVISKSITLDLGGKTLTNTNAGKATISVTSGTVTVKNGNVVGGNDYYNIEVTKNSGADLTLTDVTATAGNTGSSMIDNWGTLTITSGTYTGGLNVVKSEEGSKLTITGGTFTRETAPRWGITGTVLVYGTTTITGGTFNEKSTSTNARVVVTGRVDGYDSITYVKGGTFNGNGNNVFHHLSPAQADDSFEVSGGTFNKSIPDYYCADGFIPTKNAGGTYGVKEGQYVAKVGSKKYETLADAIRLAAKGKTITLLADVEQNTQLTINKNITLDLNGKTIKISGYTAEKAQVSVKGNLTIQDSSEAQTGKICSDYTGTAGRVVSVENGGKLTIAGGTITTEGMSGLSGSAVYIASGAEVNMTGGAVKVDAKRGNVAMNVKGSTGVFTMSGGSVIAEAGDGTETYITAISGSSGSTIQISAGTVSGPQALFARSSATTITGGSFTGSITVKNGSISGGTFDRALDKKACAAGYVPTQNGDGTYGVEIGMFTVMVTSRTTGSNSPVANVTGGGSDITYAQGTTVTASAISGYKFVGWFVNEYTGTPYSTDLTCVVKPTDDCTMIAVYEPISGGKFWLTVTASEFTVNGGAVQDSYLYEQFAVGASVTVNFTGSENFLYWVNASNKVVSTDKSYTFIMGSETTLKAVYGKARQNQATVVFISHSDQIISSKAYTTSDTIQFPVPPIKMGCTFTGWSMTESEIREAMANNNGIIQVRARYTEPSIACTVTVVYPEGTDNQVVNAVVGKAIDVTAKDIEGKTFSYWTDNAGNILGYTKTLKLAPSGDMTVKAVYDQAAEAKPVITMSEVSATTANESYVVTFMATRAVPNGYKVVKQGILWSRDAVCGEDGAAAYMQFDSNGKLPDGVRAYIGNNLDLNGVTRYDIITKYNDRTFYGRGYMVLESDAGKLLYIYTDTIASGSYDSLTK